MTLTTKNVFSLVKLQSYEGCQTIKVSAFHSSKKIKSLHIVSLNTQPAELFIAEQLDYYGRPTEVFGIQVMNFLLCHKI